MQQDEVQNIKEEGNKGQVNNSGQDTNRIMGLAAILISVLSMAAVIYQSYLAREENDLMRVQQSATVLPYIDYWYNNSGDQYQFIIENKGVGPAFIKEVTFIGIDGESKDSLHFNSSHRFYEFMKQQSSFIDSIHVIKGSFHANMLFAPNEKKRFFDFMFANDNQKKRFKNEYYKFFARLEITYEDVYGSTWIMNSDVGYPVKL